MEKDTTTGEKNEDKSDNKKLPSVQKIVNNFEKLNKKEPEHNSQKQIKKLVEKNTSFKNTRNIFRNLTNDEATKIKEKQNLTIKNSFLGTDKHLDTKGTTVKWYIRPIVHKFNEEFQETNSTTLTGTINQEYRFKDLMVADVVLRLTTDSQIKDFSLSSNDTKDYGGSNIILDVTFRSARERYALYMKHINKIPQKKLFHKHKNNINIIDYFKEYQELSEKHGHFILVLCTDWNFGFDRTNVIHVKNKNDDLCLQVRKDGPSFFQNGKITRCYKFKIIDQKQPSINRHKKVLYKTFFDNFILQTNDIDMDEFVENIWKVFKKEILDKKKVFQEFLNYIKKWFSEQEMNHTLQKHLVIRLIAMFLVSPHIHPFYVRNNSFHQESIQLIKSAIMKFRVTFFDESQSDKLQNLWYDFRNNLTEFTTLQKNMKKYQLIRSDVKKFSDLTDQEYLKYLWITGNLPIVVKYNKDVLRALELTEYLNLKFILLIDDQNINFSSFTFNTFGSIADLKVQNPNLYDKIVKLSCSFQNKCVSLKSIIDFDKRISNLITPNKLLAIADKSLKINQTDEKFPFYINRLLSKITVCLNFLNNFDENTLILISCCNTNNLKDFAASFKIVEIDESKLLKHTPPIRNTIFVKKDKCTLKFFDLICESTKTKKAHHFRLDDSLMLEWINSKGGVSDIKKYQIRSKYFEESKLPFYESYNNINVVCDEPGTGKTTLMKNFLKSASASYWSIFITARNLYSYFLKNKNNNVEKFKMYVLQDMSKDLDCFEKEMLKIFMEKNCIRFIWDGLDEVTEDNFYKILDLISILNKQGCKQWLTARNIRKNILEEKFSLISMSLKKFDKTDKNEYIRSRLKNSSCIITNYQKNLFLSHTNFLKNPLRIVIFVELSLKGTLKYEYLHNQFTVIELYEFFIDAILNDKTNQNVINKISVRNSQRDCILMYEKVAAYLYFQDKFPLDMDILNKIKNDNFGILKIEKGGKLDFFHNSFGEYFAASFLANHLKDISIVQNLIFQNQNIRHYFDLIMSKGCRAHNAVLQKNYELLRKCNDEELNMKDKLGRNVLHLACSWGTRCNLLECKKVGNVLFIDDAKDFSLPFEDESLDYKNIVEYLSKKCNPAEADYFGLNAFEYALKNNCFLAFATLVSSYKLNSENFREYLGTIIYYAVRFDYPGVFDTFHTIPLIKSRFFDKSILFLAVYYQSVNTVQKILSLRNITYKSILESGNENLLTLAYKSKNNQILLILLSNGGKLKNESLIMPSFPIQPLKNNTKCLYECCYKKTRSEYIKATNNIKKIN